MTKWFVLISFLICMVSLQSCRSHKTQSNADTTLVRNGYDPKRYADSVLAAIDTNACNELPAYFKLTNYCDRVKYLSELKVHKSNCLYVMLFDLAKASGISGSAKGTFVGIIYLEPELFFEDLKKWREYFGCK